MATRKMSAVAEKLINAKFKGGAADARRLLGESLTTHSSTNFSKKVQKGAELSRCRYKVDDDVESDAKRYGLGLSDEDERDTDDDGDDRADDGDEETLVASFSAGHTSRKAEGGGLNIYRKGK